MDWLALKPSGFLSKSAGTQMGNSEGLLAESWMISRDRIGVKRRILTEQTALLRGRLVGQRSRRVITRGSLYALAVHFRCTPGRTRCGLATADVALAGDAMRERGVMR
jgi:hypothetical protein